MVDHLTFSTLYVHDCPDQAHVNELLSMLRRVQGGTTLFWIDAREAVEEDGTFMIFHGGRFPASRKDQPRLFEMTSYDVRMASVFAHGCARLSD